MTYEAFFSSNPRQMCLSFLLEPGITFRHGRETVASAVLQTAGRSCLAVLWFGRASGGGFVLVMGDLEMIDSVKMSL